MSEVQEIVLGRAGMVTVPEEQEEYDYLDVIARNGRSYVSNKPNNRDDVTDPESWMKMTENNYDTAVRLGLFKGTEEEWVKSLSAASEEAAKLAQEATKACQEATKGANNAANNANAAAERSNTLSDHRDKIGDNSNWHTWDEEKGDYVDTGKPSKGNLMYPVFEVDPITGLLIMESDEECTADNFEINEKGELIFSIE